MRSFSYAELVGFVDGVTLKQVQVYYVWRNDKKRGKTQLEEAYGQITRTTDESKVNRNLL